MIAFEKSVGAVVFRRRGKNTIMFLVLHYRPSGRTCGEVNGHWDFPKGHQEKGESEEETLRRETAEETGIVDLEMVPKFKAPVRYFYRAAGEEKKERKENGRFINVAKKTVFYLAETKTKDVKISDEHTGHAWLCYADALCRVTYPNAKNVLKKANKYISKISKSEM